MSEDITREPVRPTSRPKFRIHLIDPKRRMDDRMWAETRHAAGRMAVALATGHPERRVSIHRFRRAA